jgi:hypothetical protein
VIVALDATSATIKSFAAAGKDKSDQDESGIEMNEILESESLLKDALGTEEDDVPSSEQQQTKADTFDVSQSKEERKDDLIRDGDEDAIVEAAAFDDDDPEQRMQLLPVEKDRVTKRPKSLSQILRYLRIGLPA